MNKSFKFFILGLAVMVAALSAVLPHEKLIYLAYLSHFFEAMLPFLAVGALVKYLFCCHK